MRKLVAVLLAAGALAAVPSTAMATKFPQKGGSCGTDAVSPFVTAPSLKSQGQGLNDHPCINQGSKP